MQTLTLVWMDGKERTLVKTVIILSHHRATYDKPDSSKQQSRFLIASLALVSPGLGRNYVKKDSRRLGPIPYRGKQQPAGRTWSNEDGRSVLVLVMELRRGWSISDGYHRQRVCLLFILLVRERERVGGQYWLMQTSWVDGWFVMRVLHPCGCCGCRCCCGCCGL